MAKSEIGLLVRSLPLAAIAGGMAWGIRGQYGHETGAMIFGVLVGLVIVLMVSPREMLGIGIAIILLFFVGRWLLYSPFDPPNKQLPYFYFSDHWQWEDASNVRPRPEVWGGLLIAFAGLMGYFVAIKRDPLPVLLGLWGIAGGLGFPIGQSMSTSTSTGAGTTTDWGQESQAPLRGSVERGIQWLVLSIPSQTMAP